MLINYKKIARFFSALLDYFLILSGVIMLLLAWLKINLPEARYVILFFGTGLICAGFWFRIKSRMEEKNNRNADKPL